MPAVLVQVRCRNGHTRDIRPGEIEPNDFPMCQVCYRPMVPMRTVTVKREVLTPAGRRLENVPRSTARPGDILAYRRKRGGWSHQDVARIDGDWTPLEIALMEGQVKQTSANVARYVRALERLEREAAK